MIEREANQDSDTRFTIRLIESTRDEHAAPVARVFLTSTVDSIDRLSFDWMPRWIHSSARPEYTKQGIVSPFDFDSLFGQRGGPTTSPPPPPRFGASPSSPSLDGDVYDRGSFEQWRGWRERLGHCWVNVAAAIIIHPSDFWIQCNR